MTCSRPRWFGVCLLVAVTLARCVDGAAAQDRDRPFHPEFPPKDEGQLSPPVVYRPIYECAEAVHVMGFVPHAHVQVFAGGAELVGKADPPFGFTFVPIVLSRPLKEGELITATQTIGGITSAQSTHPVKVEKRPPGALPMPKVHPFLYECGIIVPVGDMTESVRVKIFDGGSTVIGNAAVAGKWQPIFTSPLLAGHDITAQLFACEHMGPSATLIGPMSSPTVKVQPAPSPIPAPIVPKEQQIPGNDVANVYGLLVGALVKVHDRGALIGQGYATGEANWVPLSKRLETASILEVTQELCGVVSPPSPPVSPEGKLEAPQVLAPICDGQQYAVIRNTTVNATVVLFRNGGVVGYGGAAGGDVILALGGGAKFNGGDQVIARQYMGMTLSPPSPPVNVQRQLEAPSLEIVGGESFFEPEDGEQAINGPVFPRGRTPGPSFLIQSCCTKNVELRIEMENGTPVATLPLTEVFPGYHTAQWDWNSVYGWPVPHGIPVGRYVAIAKSECSQGIAKKPFNVIFNPADVGGPARFSFDETGIWFGAGSNSMRALLYHLHPDDRRVFDIAMNAAQGTTDSADAAQRIVDAEEMLFDYDLGYHGNDVLNMIENESEAQCADDANVLTALLRSMGIPAHPATADAALETGAANWTFDTWTEFLAPHGGPPEWRIFHPHEYTTMGPETRTVFGNRPVATKSFNDLVIMADVNWDWAQASDSTVDVSYGRQTCGEPEQNISKAFWVREICEEGYWAPNHWSCDAFRLSTSGLTADFSAPSALLAWGGRMRRTAKITNLTDVEMGDDVVFEVVADLPESKRFPDEVLTTTKLPLKLLARAEAVLPMTLELPKTNPVGAQLYVRARIGETTIAVEPLEIRPLVDVRIKTPGRIRVGEKAPLEITIAGNSAAELAGLRMTVTAPRGMSGKENDRLRFDNIRISRAEPMKIELSPTYAIDAGEVVVDVESSNGGSTRIRAPITVESGKKFATPTPAYPVD